MTPRSSTKRNHLRTAFLTALLGFIASHLCAADGQIDLLPSPTGTTTISTSGSYVLVENVTYTDLTTPCISITANNTVLDLNGHTITGSGGSDVSNTAITIDANKQRVIHDIQTGEKQRIIPNGGPQ